MFLVVVEETISDEDKYQIVNLKQFNACEMQSLIFTEKDFDAWSSKMKSFLKSANLWNFVENGFDDPRDEAKDVLALYLIQQSLDASIFFRIVAANTSKEAWEILNKEYNAKGSITKTIVNQNDEAIVNIVEAKGNMKIEDNEINLSVSEREHEHMVNINKVQYASVDAEENKESNIDIEEENNEDIDLVAVEVVDNNLVTKAKDETIEALYDEENLSDEEWRKIMQEKKLIDNLSKGQLLKIMDDDESAAAMKTEKVVLDNFHAKAEDDICEANDALVVEQYENKNVTNDILNILMNVFKCADLEKLAEADEQIHFAIIKMDCVQVMDYTNTEAKRKFEDSI